MKTPLSTPTTKRKGIILLVVLAMLTLLAIIGITFVMYATSLEQVSEAVLDEQKADVKPRIDPETALNMVLGQLVYDLEDDTFGKASVVRGHSLARDIYGYSSTNQNFPLDRPFGGFGFTDPTTNQTELARVNFFGKANVSGQPNVAYTAPDYRHWYLAGTYIDPTTKALKVNEPSFWRNTVSSTSTGISDQKTFRYRPGVEMANGFPPYPTQSQKYDVINLPGGTTEDSIWIDINAPIQTLPNGKKYKMMVAPLILDMDGRLNLNWAGNRMARSGSAFVHGSHEGWGPWEANPDKLLAAMGALPPGVNWLARPSAMESQILDVKYGGANNHPQGYAFPGGGSGGGGSGGISGGYSPRAHFQVDFNGGLDVNPNSATSGMPAFLPGSPLGNHFQAFPYFHPGVFGNWALVETSSNGAGSDYIHPVGYNPSFPKGLNISFAIRDLGPLLLWNSKKDTFVKDASNSYSPTKLALGSFLAKYGESNSKDSILDHITLHSADFDKPGLSGNLTDRLTQGLRWNTPNSSSPPYWPQRPSMPGMSNMGPISEFNNLGLAIGDLTRFARINLANIGPDYPNVESSTGQYPKDPMDPSKLVPQYYAAVKARTLLASKILDGLCSATGTPNYLALGKKGDSNDKQYAAWVWLAQLAANIVDFVDPDDVMTVLDISPTISSLNQMPQRIFGTELPKVVINEIYAQADNDQIEYSNGQKAKKNYPVSVFIELLNPTPSSEISDSTNINRKNDAYLQYGSTTPHVIYQVELSKDSPDSILAIKDPFANSTDGVLGNSSNPYKISETSATNSIIDKWFDSSNNNGTISIKPIGQNHNGTGPDPFDPTNPATPRNGKQGILWIGPKVSTTLRDISDTSFQSLDQPNLKFDWVNGKAAPSATVLLRRLADPGLPHDLISNPYVLVDYAAIHPKMVQDARKSDDQNANLTPTPVASRNSYARRQPYGGNAVDLTNTNSLSNLGAYVPSKKSNTGAPLHSFGFLNVTQPGDTTYTNPPTTFVPTTGDQGETPDWLVHYDRQLVSPAGLLLVSTFRPHELTQKFLNIDSTTSPQVTTKAHQHAAAWMDEQTGLHRFLEMVQCHGEYGMSDGTNLVNLLPSGGRMQGRVNLNTTPISSDGSFSPILDALLDANTTSHFSATDVRNLATRLAQDRTAGNYITGLSIANRLGSLFGKSVNPTYPPTSKDLWDTDPKYQLKWDPYAHNNNATVSPNGAAPRAQSNSVHPLVRLEMLDKILNQTTIRSNVFGIWLTVGFFEVTDSTTVPVKLGGEIGAAAGRQTRYKLFSLVDRTRIKAFETKATAAISPEWETDPSTGNTTGNYKFKIIPINHSQPFVDASNNPTNIEPRTGKTISLLNLAQAQPLVLTIDPDTINEETVEAVFNNNQLEARFRRNHASGAKIISRGNPGPMKDYKVNDDSEVVFFWTILE